MSTCFVAGLVKALVEGNSPHTHFGSLMAYEVHLSDSIHAGVVKMVGKKPQVTNEGHIWYKELELDKMPAGSRSHRWDLTRKLDYTYPRVKK